MMIMRCSIRWMLRVGWFLILAGGWPVASLCAQSSRPTEAEARIREGWAFFALGEYHKAVAAFDEAAAESDKDSDAHRAATYGLATTWNLRQSAKDENRATRLYAEIIQQTPRSDWAAWSRLALARMKYLTPPGKEPNRQEVIAAYQDVIENHPNHPAAQEAFLYEQALRIATLKKDEAFKCVASLDKYTQGDALYRSTAFALLAQCHAILGHPEAQLHAEVCAVETLEMKADHPMLDRAAQYWKIAVIAEFEVGDFDIARRYYRRLLAEHPTDHRSYAAETALKRIADFEKQAGGAP